MSAYNRDRYMETRTIFRRHWELYKDITVLEICSEHSEIEIPKKFQHRRVRQLIRKAKLG